MREENKFKLFFRIALKIFRADPTLCISGILAVISCFFVHPDAEYVGYINFRVLAILFALMLIVGALGRIGTFDYLTSKLLASINSEKKLSLFLVVLSFFMSMLLTNDVTLVTLVPFAIMVLKAFDDRRRTMYTLILMTVAANLGSMLTPIGNPQNLFLYTEYEMDLGRFILLMLPYSAISLALLIVSVLILNKTDRTADVCIANKPLTPDKKKLSVYIALFILSVMTVAGWVHFLIMLAVVSVVILIIDRKSFINVDYALLITFSFFFVLIGNLGRIDVIYQAIKLIVEKNVMLTAVLSSQIISNVPAAILLSAFTDNGEALVVGTNLGGLGTLIASMASLITFKFYSSLKRSYVKIDAQKSSVSNITKNKDTNTYNKNNTKNEGGNYLLSFTVVNIIFLVILYGAYLIIS